MVNKVSISTDLTEQSSQVSCFYQMDQIYVLGIPERLFKEELLA